MEHDINPLRMGAFHSINWLYSCPDVLECTFSGINRVAVFEMFCYQSTVTAFCLLMFILVRVEKPPVLMENFISCDVTGNQSNCSLGGSSQRRAPICFFQKLLGFQLCHGKPARPDILIYFLRLQPDDLICL